MAYKYDMRRFAGRLRQLREDRGETAREVSLLMRQSAGYISNLERGHNYPSMEMFFKLCWYYGVTPQEFFQDGTESDTERIAAKVRRLPKRNRAMVETIIEELRRQ